MEYYNMRLPASVKIAATAVTLSAIAISYIGNYASTYFNADLENRTSIQEDLKEKVINPLEKIIDFTKNEN